MDNALTANLLRVETTCGIGTVRYIKPDGWLGVQLDGEKRVDEYPAEHCTEVAS
jgi:hypothetical protein